MTVAELKRRLVDGVRLRQVLTPRGPCNQLRVVDGYDSVDVWFTGDGIKEGEVSHLRWPRAAELRETEGGFEILEGGKVALGYLWVVDDFAVEHGGLHVIQPLSQKARDWLNENLSGEQSWVGGGLVVDGDYIDELVIAMQDADLVRRP